MSARNAPASFSEMEVNVGVDLPSGDAYGWKSSFSCLGGKLYQMVM